MRLLPMELRLPGVCSSCRQPVVFTGKRWQDPGRQSAHVCPVERPVCGAWMPNNRERCARRPGHTGVPGRGYGHRSATALQNAARRWAA